MMNIGTNTFKLILLRHGQSELNHENIFCGWIDASLTQKGRDQAKNAADLIISYCKENNVSLPLVGYISRLIRTRQTMEAILSEMNLKGSYEIVTGSNYRPVRLKEGHTHVMETWRLNERHYGSWQGQRKPNVLKEYGEDQYMYIRRDYQGKPPAVDLNREMLQEVNDQGSSTGYEFKEPNRHLKYHLEEQYGESLPASESLKDVEKRLEPFIRNVVIPVAQENELDSSLIIGHGSSVRSILKILQGIPDEEIKKVDIANATPLIVELEKTNFRFLKSYYLDPKNAKIDAEKVRREGFQPNP